MFLRAGLQHPDSPAALHLQRGVRVHLLQRDQRRRAEKPVALPQLLHHLHRGRHRPQLLQVLQPASPLEHRGTGESDKYRNTGAKNCHRYIYIKNIQQNIEIID